MTTHFSLSFEFPDGTEKEIEFECEFGKGGIGVYEYHGQKCYDAGKWDLDNISYNEEDFTKEDCKFIEEKILDSQRLIDEAWNSLNDI